MAFNDNTVDNVKDALQEIQELRVQVQKNKLNLSDAGANATELTDAERDAVRIRMNNRIQNLRAAIIAQVGTW